MAEKLQAEPCVKTTGHSMGKGGHEYSSKGAFQAGSESNEQNSKGNFSPDWTAIFFFFFCIVFPLDFKELYVGEDPVEGIWKPQVLVLIQTRTETQVWRLSTGACPQGWSDFVS